MAHSTKITALYERLSCADELQGPSNSILNQQVFLEDLCKRNSFTNVHHFTDDGVSGTTFDRDGFKAMIAELEAGYVATIIVKEDCVIIILNQKGLENQVFWLSSILF